MHSHFLPISLIAAAAVTTAVAAPPKAVAPASAKAESLFDGQTLSGWSGLPSHWTVRDGAITGYTIAANPIRQNTFLVWTNGTLRDFELHLKYRMVGGNSGVQYRSQLMDPAEFVVGGYQADIDSSPRYSGILYEERGRGILCERGQRTLVKDAGGKTEVKVVGTLGTPEALQKFIHADGWNDYTIVAQGNQVMHFINGRLMSDCVDLGGKGAREGLLALQIHTGPPMMVQFKDLQLYRLPDAPAETGLPASVAKPSPAQPASGQAPGTSGAPAAPNVLKAKTLTGKP